MNRCSFLGVYTKEECHIDLGKLCSFAGARLILSSACRLDHGSKYVYCSDGRPPISYDICSIDIGISPTSIPVSEDSKDIVTPVKPISEFSERWSCIVNRVLASPPGERQRIAIIGGGAGGVELCFSINQRLKSELKKAGRDENLLEITIFSNVSTLMPSHNSQVQSIIHRIMKEKMINVVTNASIIGVKGTKDSNGVLRSELVAADSRTFSFDEAISCTSACAQPWLRDSGLETTKEGFICVQPTLESTNVRDVFACGDVAHLVDNPRPKVN